MSLSTWFRDYLYIPLGGNQVSAWRHAFNLLVTFVVSGLWHGASWTFVVWGGIHGGCLILAMATVALRQNLVTAIGLDAWPSVHRAWRTLCVLSLVTFAWIFFRANSMADAVYIVTQVGRALASVAGTLASFDSDAVATVITPAAFSTVGLRRLLPAFAAIALIETVRRFQPGSDIRAFFRASPAWVRWAFYYALVGFLMLFGNYGAQQFVYFQF
jgi:hypothetical protein